MQVTGDPILLASQWWLKIRIQMNRDPWGREGNYISTKGWSSDLSSFELQLKVCFDIIWTQSQFSFKEMCLSCLWFHMISELISYQELIFGHPQLLFPAIRNLFQPMVLLVLGLTARHRNIHGCKGITSRFQKQSCVNQSCAIWFLSLVSFQPKAGAVICLLLFWWHLHVGSLT